MTIKPTPTHRGTLIAFTVATFSVCLLPCTSQAQTENYEGYNIVYQTSAPSPTLTTSPAFIDALPAYNANGQDICAAINSIFVSTNPAYPSNGAVIDARGALPPSSALAVSCGSNPFANANGKPSVVLLPAANITISTTWQLPSNTRIVGEGSNATYIQAGSGFSGGSTDMIEMGSSSFCSSSPCSGISIEHLELSGQSQSVNGIENYAAQESSFVDDVFFDNAFGATNGAALLIDALATGSGPYSNINYQCGTNGPSPVYCPAATLPCVSINATTRGLHGVTCVAVSTKSSQPSEAILLSASNNSIEDIHIEGFSDGVVVGSQGSAQADVLLNVHGGLGNGPVTNVVHICNPNAQTANGNCPAKQTQPYSVSDIGLFQIGLYQTSGTTILDDLTSTEWNVLTALNNSYTGMYAVGNNNQVSNGYSRFTTIPGPNNDANGSSGVPTWGVGASAPSSNSCNSPGAFYSNTTGSVGSHNTIFVCVGGTWQGISM
jgi:hypothetical protein